VSADRVAPGRVRRSEPTTYFATTARARADLQRHLDGRAHEGRQFARAAEELRGAPPEAPSILLRRFGWTVFEIPAGAVPGEVARRTGSHLWRRVREARQGRARVVAFLVLLAGGGVSLVLSGVLKLRLGVPTCYGEPMRLGEMCRVRPTGPTTDGMPVPSDATYQQQLDSLSHEGWTSIGLGVVLLAVFLLLMLVRGGRRPRTTPSADSVRR